MDYGLSSVLRISLCDKKRSLADFLQTVGDAPGLQSSLTQRRQLLWLLLSAPVDYVTDDLVSWSSVLSQVSLGTPPLISLLTISDKKHRSGSDWQRQSSIVGAWNNLFKMLWSLRVKAAVSLCAANETIPCRLLVRDRRYGTSRPLSIYFLRVYISCFIWMHILLFIWQLLLPQTPERVFL